MLKQGDKMERKIIFLDIDGTLTLPKGGVSSRVKDAITQVRQNGHYVFICSGRNRAGVESLMPIGFDGAICSAGGYIEINGQKIYESCLCDEDLKIARDVFDRNHVLYNLETTHITFSSDEMNKEFVKMQLNGEKVNSEMMRLMNEQMKQFNIHSLEEFNQNPIPVQKLCFIARDEKDLIEPRDILSKRYHFIVHELFSKETINGEIIIKGTNKGKAIQKVVEILGLSMDDTIGFGDSMNDFEMIQVCHYGVAMANGSEELKAYASTVCESVEDDGVYHELKRLVLCE